MTLGRRMAMLFKAKASTASDRAEDPRETLDYSYENSSSCCSRSAAGWPTWRPAASVELQAQQLGSSTDRLQQQAAQALAAGGRIWPARR